MEDQPTEQASQEEPRIEPAEPEIPFEVLVEKEVDRRLDEERTRLVKEVRRTYETNLESELQKYRSELDKQNKEMMTKLVEDFKKSQQPPTQEEIQKILDAEYLRFPVKIKLQRENSEPVELKVEITELSAANEKKMLRLLKEKIGPIISTFTPAILNIMQGDQEDKVTAILDLIDPVGDTIEELVSMILSAHTGQIVSTKDIANSLSYSRQIAIITAQMECNRLRDFFLHAVRIAGS